MGNRRGQSRQYQVGITWKKPAVITANIKEVFTGSIWAIMGIIKGYLRATEGGDPLRPISRGAKGPKMEGYY